MNRTLLRSDPYSLAAPLALSADGKAPPSILVFRWGVNETSKGNLVFDELGWKQIEAAYRTYGNALGFDGEHETFSRDRKAPGVVQSYGWTKALRTDSEGLWADVEWTDDVVKDGAVVLGGRTLIETKRVKYFSPVLDYERNTGRIVRLHTFALTIYPATHNQRPLVASAALGQGPERTTMNPIAIAMGLRPDADEGTVCSAVQAMRSSVMALCHALGVADEAKALEVARVLSQGRQAILAATGAKDEQEALGAVRAGQVARERLTTVEKENAELREENTRLARSQLFAAHPTKWTPALREKYGNESVAFLTKMTEDLPEQATASAAATPPGAATATEAAQLSAAGGQVVTTPAAGVALTADEKKLAASMGVTEAEFAADLAKERARRGQKPGFALH